jgi:hypothetical protein
VRKRKENPRLQALKRRSSSSSDQQSPEAKVLIFIFPVNHEAY